MSGDPFGGLDPGLATYEFLTYKYPRFASQPVIRIPIAGPPPYNTLAVVRVQLGAGFSWATGKIKRNTSTYATNLIIKDYDPERHPEQRSIVHSTAGGFHSIQIVEGEGPHIGDWNTEWLYAIDNFHLESSVTSDGRWCLTADTAGMVDGRISGATLEATSWVMFWEPPSTQKAKVVLGQLGQLGQLGRKVFNKDLLEKLKRFQRPTQ
ncbi:hypothetical protein RBB84_12360 [Rhodococcus sp. D-6]|uniref:Uncharacterized protein n=1 Tax=Rhodococcus sp. D-6 TaxID=1387842 RepID=A0AAU7V3E5_9NOCA